MTKAIDVLAANQATILTKALRALVVYGAEFAAEADVHRLTVENVAQQVQFRHASVLEKRGLAYIDFAGECAWDREHGFDVIFDRLRVVDVCQQGTGWVDRGRSRKELNDVG